MAKKEPKESAESTAPVTSGRPKVLVHQGHHDNGTLRPAVHAEIDWPDATQNWDPTKQPATVYIDGQPHVQIGHAEDGSKVYAHEDVRKRA